MKATLLTICLFLGLVLPLRAAELLSGATTSVSVPAAKSTSVIKAWPHEGSDLKPDVQAFWGRMENGVRYVILPTKQAPTRATLRMYMDVGSLMEKEDQRGLAHFLEHMAFNGTNRFPAGQTIEYFQRLGMAFGAHTNAATYLDRTVYQLELPRANEELTGDGLKLLRDILDGMLLDEKEIERERGVILSEIRSADTAAQRAAVPSLSFSAPEALIARRLPLGDAASVRSLTRQRFVDFYETWYTPARTVIVATGDFNVSMVEQLIRRNFEDARARRGEQPDASIGTISPSEGVTAKLHSDMELENVAIVLSVVGNSNTERDGTAHQYGEMVQALGDMMLNQRLKKLATAKDACFQSASVDSEGGSLERKFGLAVTSSISANCQPQQWNAALAAMEREIRRALKFGFTDSEFAETKAMVSMMLQASADGAENRQPNELADGIVRSLSKNEVFMHPTDELAFGNGLLSGVTKEQCEQALRKMWDTDNRRIWVQGNLQLSGNAAEQIIAAYRKSQQQVVDPPADAATGNWAYTDFGAAGEIVHREEQKDLDLVQAVFANNVRVNIKHSDFEKSMVRVLVRFGGGVLEVPADKPGLRALAGSTFIAGGLEAHDLTEVNRILSDKQIGLRFAVGDDAFQLEGCCQPKMLETELQVCAAYLVAPGFRPEVHQRFIDDLERVYANAQHTAEGLIGDSVLAFVHGDDPRFKLPSREAMQQLTVDDVKAWLAQPLHEGYMEVTLVGDIDADAALPLIAKTLGALPKRAAVKPDFAEQRPIKFPASPKTKEFHFESQAPRAYSVVCWPTCGCRDIPRDHRLTALAHILGDRLRLKVRQELGATYTPSVSSNTSDGFPDFGFLEADLNIEPQRVGEIGPLVVSIGADLAAGNISDDEFDRAMKPVLASLDAVERNNAFWLVVLADSQEHPFVLDAVRRRKKDYQSISKADVQSLAREYLTSGNATIINVLPNPAGK